MKKDIHPQVYDVVFQDAGSGAQFISTSTTKSDRKVTIDGKEYFVILMEVTSDTHPFFTGKQRLLDAAGRADKFQARRQKAAEIKAKNAPKIEDTEEATEAAA